MLGEIIIDIYFEPNYGMLYEEIENGNSIVFEYESDLGKIQHMFIKRKIPTMFKREIYYDLTTPYGYGGPIILNSKEESLEELISDFKKVFKKYCIDNNIVSEFVRFHPVLGNAKSFNNVYDIQYLRNTVATSLAENEDPFTTEFSKSTRKTVRRSLKAGLSYRITEKPKTLNTFMKIYYSTMDRNNASDYYYFNEEYFANCLESFRENIILTEVLYEEKVIASSLNFIYGNTVHVHLSGTLSEYINMSPAYIIKYGTLEWAKENKVKLIHYGGGTSNSESDSLYQFKKRFTKSTEFEFYIGKKVWNSSVYKQLCEANNIDEGVDFFPAYRSEGN